MPSKTFGSAKPVKQACVVVVTGKLAPGQLDTLMEAFKPLAAHAAHNEDGCLAYEMSVNNDEPDSFVVYERYTSKDYLEQVHLQSEPFKNLMRVVETLEWVEPMRIKMYQELDIGF